LAYKKLKYWFDQDLAVLLSKKILAHYRSFYAENFIQAVADGTKNLELKDRVEFIADQLRIKLPKDFTQALDILLKILGPENKNETGMFSEYYWIMPIAKFVEKYGLNHFPESMNAIKKITKRNTGEYCIRPFIEKYPDKTLALLKKWSLDANVHLRRLSSEGLRPRLPWAKKIDRFIDNPKPVLDIIDNLKDDGSKFVQKSVANNLNDILKDNYEIGMKAIRKWSKGATPNRKWIIKHALRNQIKSGNVEAVRIVAALN
jgi:3-methyladenine DNA glycosylase AlkC